MFDLLVFTQYPKAYGPSRILKEAQNSGFKIKIFGYKNINDIGRLPKGKGVVLREPNPKPELYKLRDAILKHYVNNGSYVLNHKSYLRWSVLDKITQSEEFKKSGISYIKQLRLAEAKYPYIVKNKLGSHGDSVYKIENEEDLKKVLLKHDIKDLLVQEFQTAGFDLRVIVLRGKVLGIMKRTPKRGEFLSNFSQGGNVIKFNTVNETINLINAIAIKTAKHFKLDYCGVDLMLGNDGEWKVLEVNRACQFKGFELSTGINVAGELVQFTASI